MREVTNTQAIRDFFEQDGGRKVTMDELKKLPMSDREELGALCAKAIGATIKAAALGPFGSLVVTGTDVSFWTSNLPAGDQPVGGSI